MGLIELAHNRDVPYFCHTRRKESAETSFYFYKRKCSPLLNNVVHFVSRLSFTIQSFE